MKKLNLLLSIVVITFSSCSSGDDSSNTTDPDAVLPIKIVSNSQDGNYTDNFFYNGKKITKIVGSDGQETIFTYTGDLITKAETFFDGEIESTETYTYDSMGRLNGYTSAYVDSPGFNNQETYVHNANGTISFTLNEGGTLYSTGTFTMNGNDILNVVSNYTGIGITSTNSYTYDAKFTPYKNITGFKWYIFAGSENESTGFDHNVLTFNDSETPSNNSSATFTYNTLNFPVTGTFTYNSSTEISTVTYN